VWCGIQDFYFEYTYLRNTMLRVSTVVLTYLVAAAGVRAESQAETCDIAGKTLARTGESPEACKQPDFCPYKCAGEYVATVADNILTLTSTKSFEGCECYTLSANLVLDQSVLTWSFINGHADGDDTKFKGTYNSDTGTAQVLVSTQGVFCTGTYSVKPTPPCDLGEKKLTRTSVSPDACNVPSACAYKCAAEYESTVVGKELTLTSTKSAGDCPCYPLFATLVPDKGSICKITDGHSNEDATEFTGTYDSKTGIAKVLTSTQGAICTGTFSTPVPAPEPEPEPATPASALSSWVLPVLVVAGVLILILAGVIVFLCIKQQNEKRSDIEGSLLSGHVGNA
jgi:hypothetical protein